MIPHIILDNDYHFVHSDNFVIVCDLSMSYIDLCLKVVLFEYFSIVSLTSDLNSTHESTRFVLSQTVLDSQIILRKNSDSTRSVCAFCREDNLSAASML